MGKNLPEAQANTVKENTTSTELLRSLLCFHLLLMGDFVTGDYIAPMCNYLFILDALKTFSDCLHDFFFFFNKGLKLVFGSKVCPGCHPSSEHIDMPQVPHVVLLVLLPEHKLENNQKSSSGPTQGMVPLWGLHPF